jgi:hypothetical protein
MVIPFTNTAVLIDLGRLPDEFSGEMGVLFILKLVRKCN